MIFYFSPVPKTDTQSGDNSINQRQLAVVVKEWLTGVVSDAKRHLTSILGM